MGHTSELNAFLNVHKDQLISSGVPEHLWQTLYRKLVNQIFDAGHIFQILKLEYEQREEHEPIWALQALKFIDKEDLSQIYLIDHAWTFRVEQAKSQLLQHERLRDRMGNLFDISNTLPKDQMAEHIIKNLWKACNHYSIANAENIEQRLPVWYLMDEIGTAVLHSDDPNVRIVPFVYVNDQITYSILFPIKDIEEGDIVYRDFAEGISNKERRSAILLPWKPKSFDSVNITPRIADAEYFLQGHVRESLPVKILDRCIIPSDFIKVFTQYSLVKSHLTYKRFVLVDNEEEADILWYTEHFKNFESLSQFPNKFVNQFPFEYVLTVKDLLCITCRRKQNVPWFPITYNLLTELPNFVSYFQRQEKESDDNYWIVKPYNLARGLDIHITNNLSYILKLSVTGPKIVQKYITKPVVFYRPECNGKVKFDIRYVILLKCVKPLKAYAYKNFFLRFANKPFELSGFDEYEKHFTVMNYTENAKLKHLKCEDFLIQWEQQYVNHPWEEVELSILKMLKEILECATMVDPPCGIANNPQCRALYAADIILEWDQNKDEIQPKILEINFTPDCERACEYYVNFYNDIFKLLFLDEDSGEFLDLANE